MTDVIGNPIPANENCETMPVQRKGKINQEILIKPIVQTIHSRQVCYRYIYGLNIVVNSWIKVDLSTNQVLNATTLWNHRS